MGCVYCNFDGVCDVFSDLVEMPGADEFGNCICEDDEDPSRTCESYEKEEYRGRR